ncbi:MAG: isoprenyl transferase [Bacteroidetes bacterium]|nr:isoprenyl transferase [Bacteroidota bacterium]
MDPVTLTDKAQSEQDLATQRALKQSGSLPHHVAVIMDGNGRWARERGSPRVRGHREGVASVRDVVEACAQLGVEYLTLYTFSTENWDRPAREVNALMKLLIHTIRKERDRLLENNIRLQAIGDLDKLPGTCAAELEGAMRDTATNTRMTLTLALSYSGRWEIVEAARTLARRVQQGSLDPDEIDEALFDATLGDLPDPDLLIRTGGEHRISNFLLWQLAYTEMYITDLFWPAFRRDQLYEAIRDFQDRERRFGRVLDA